VEKNHQTSGNRAREKGLPPDRNWRKRNFPGSQSRTKPTLGEREWSGLSSEIPKGSDKVDFAWSEKRAKASLQRWETSWSMYYLEEKEV